MLQWATSEDLPPRRTSPVVSTTRAALSLSLLSPAPPPRVVELRAGSLPPTTIEQVVAAPDPSFPPYLARARQQIWSVGEGIRAKGGPCDDNSTVLGLDWMTQELDSTVWELHPRRVPRLPCCAGANLQALLRKNRRRR
jgi:hypothetical protein